MKNLFSNIKIISNSDSYSVGDRVIYNHEMYSSTIDNNNALPSTGNASVDNVISLEYNKEVDGSAWDKI